MEARYSYRMPQSLRAGSDEAQKQARILWVDEWTESLIGANDDRVDIGLSRLRKRQKDEFPPTAGEFRELCMPSYEEMGWPTPVEAYSLACHGCYDHNAVYTVACELDRDWLRRGTINQTRKPFLEAYKTLRADYLAGKPLDVRPPPRVDRSLEQQPKTAEQIAQEELAAEQARAELKKLYGKKNGETQSN